jgi:hypothetical protein
MLWWRHTTASTTSSEFSIFSSKSGSGATVLRGHDILVIRNRGTWDCYSQDVAVLHFAVVPFCSWGLCPSQPADYWTQLCSCQLLIGISYSAPHTASPPKGGGKEAGGSGKGGYSVA